MKKNLTRKLALSAVTMGVAALTVTSTTYAWYTTNSTATANGMKASTAATNSNMLIATRTTTGSGASNDECTDITQAYWQNTAEFIDKSDTLITPVQYYKVLDSKAQNNYEESYTAVTAGWKNVDGTTTQENPATVVTYRVWFSTTSLTSNATYTLKMTVASATFSANGEMILEGEAASKTADDASKKNYQNGKTLSVGLQDALSFKVSKAAEYKDRVKNENEGKTGSYTEVTGNYCKVTANDSYFRFLNEVTDKADALVYYNNVMGKSLDRPTTNNEIGKASDENAVTNYIDYSNSGNGIGGTGTTDQDTKKTSYSSGTQVDIATITGTTDVYFGLDITLFIDGWDYQCFNAISKTSLESMNLQFELTKSN